jgi:5-hydroxyisourate hydrolase
MITTHVLDTARGRPAAGIPVVLEQHVGADRWQVVGRGSTDADGRLRTLVPAGSPLPSGVYRLVFEVAPYFRAHGTPAFYPRVVVEFETRADESHYHVPLLLGPFGFTTYRGS